MKKLTILALFVGLLSSCTAEYAAKDRDGAPILIKDRNNVIDNAIALGLDSVYVRKFNNDDYYLPIRSMGKEQTMVNSDTIGGKRHTWYTTYRIVRINSLIKR